MFVNLVNRVEVGGALGYVTVLVILLVFLTITSINLAKRR
jgi:hypothetical protein